MSPRGFGIYFQFLRCPGSGQDLEVPDDIDDPGLEEEKGEAIPNAVSWSNPKHDEGRIGIPLHLVFGVEVLRVKLPRVGEVPLVHHDGRGRHVDGHLLGNGELSARDLQGNQLGNCCVVSRTTMSR